MQSGDRLICVFVNPLSIGTSFRNWPLHVTVIPWFRTAISTEALISTLSVIVSSHKSFDILLSNDTKFGYRRSKIVTLVQLPSPLLSLETDIRRFLHSQDAWIADESTKRRRPYQPHVTAQSQERLYPGDAFTCVSCNIVEQRGVDKEVVGKISLGT